MRLARGHRLAHAAFLPQPADSPSIASPARWLCGIAACWALGACSVERFLAEDELLYEASEITFATPDSVPDVDELRASLQSQVQQEATGKVGMWWYFKLAHPDSAKGLKPFLRKTLGAAPEYYDELEAEQGERLMADYLKDHGYFGATVERDTVHPDPQHVTVRFEVATPLGRSRMSRVEWPTDSSEYGRFGEFLDEYKPGTFVREGEYYSVPKLNAERARIDKLSERRGYFEFTTDNVYYVVDSAAAAGGSAVFMRLDDGGDSLAFSRYHIGRTYVYPDFEIGADTAGARFDTTYFEDLAVVRDTTARIGDAAIARRIGLREGDLYDRAIYDNTINQLLDLGVFRYVNYRFERRLTDTTPVLDQFVYLTQGQSQTLSADVETTTQQAASGLGFAVSGRYGNTNLFGGAEDFNLTLSAGVGPQIALDDPEETVIATEYSGRAELALPRFLGPWAHQVERSAYFIPRTLASVNYQLTQRPEFQLQNFGLRLGYRYRANAYASHELYPLSASYTATSGTTEVFDSVLLASPRLAQGFENVALLGVEYGFQYTDQTSTTGRTRPFFALDAGVRTSGLLSSALASPSAPDPETGATRPPELGGVGLSQFVKVFGDGRYTVPLGSTAALATRVYAGWAQPVMDTEVIPYVEQFFAGGPNSIRAFQLRGVGPGRSIPPSETPGDQTFLNQTGDVRFEANVELRADLGTPFLEGAAFVDAGNVWIINDIGDEAPEGVFDAGDVLAELAAGAGIGLRVDVEIILIRFDYAVPFHRPWLIDRDDADAFGFTGIGDGRLNIAIGYPF